MEQIPVDLEQPMNKLSKIASDIRKTLITKNDYSADKSRYGVTSPDALSDGDDRGRGTGVFLDVYNQAAGDKTDIAERKNEIKINRYNASKPYPDFQI